MTTAHAEAGLQRDVRVGLRANLGQFSLLLGVNGLVGALIGQERALVPLLGERVFLVSSSTALMMFIVTFGAAKAVSNLAAGYLADRIGRRNVLLLGWAAGLPVPFILMLAPSWIWVVAANVLLGLNQGLAWSATVVMKIDLVGPKRRGLAMGLNEFTGYLAVAFSAAASGWLAARYGLRPEPLFLGVAIAGLGLGASLFARETSWHMEAERNDARQRPFGEVFALTSFRDPGLAAASRTGLVNNANDAAVWGLLPLLMTSQGFSTVEIGLVAALYPAVWGIAQLGTGLLSDHVGRRGPISVGMWTQALALLWFSAGGPLEHRVGAAILLGCGTALTYPALLAAVGDRAEPAWRASAVGIYRMWRDGGYVVGALAVGALADLYAGSTALAVIAAVTGLSGIDAWIHTPSSSDELNSLGFPRE